MMTDGEVEETVSGITHFQGANEHNSIALANNWLMVGHLGDERCPFGCPGEATVYDVNRFR